MLPPIMKIIFFIWRNRPKTVFIVNIFIQNILLTGKIISTERSNFNKQSITLDNSYRLLYTVNERRGYKN